MVVVADVGDSLFAASDLTIHRHTEFLAPAYYTSMGFAIPAAIGVQAANSKLRPIVLVGDGAFQMTCMELSTAVAHGFNPVVLVLNNRGYTTERFLQDGPFNDIPNWNYHRLPDLVGGGWGFEIHTEGELDQALKAACRTTTRSACSISTSSRGTSARPSNASPVASRKGSEAAAPCAGLADRHSRTPRRCAPGVLLRRSGMEADVLLAQDTLELGPQRAAARHA